MSHSPLPWGFMGQLIVSDCDRKIAEVEFSDRMVDDRNLIVTAVNNHAKLVDTLVGIMNDCNECLGEDADMPTFELIEAIRNACECSLRGLLPPATTTHDVAQP